MRSSYAENNYGEVFRAIVDAFKPVNCVELGVLDGYSTSHIAAALERNGRGMLNAYDLFEKYAFRHANYKDLVEKFSGNACVRIHQEDAFLVHEQYPDNTVDFIHIDISNNGETVRRMMELWDPKMVQGGIILFEGGTEERDNVEWMKAYNKEPMKPEFESNKIILGRYIFGTYLKFPGLTMLLKKR